ncbi:hypothetical protein BGX38DRAFT_1280986 [Terfezia claveryi]|nr:hypothetical protein BGX38DRAFT_1280986 [Terfezia claveryi]
MSSDNKDPIMPRSTELALELHLLKLDPPQVPPPVQIMSSDNKDPIMPRSTELALELHLLKLDPPQVPPPVQIMSSDNKDPIMTRLTALALEIQNAASIIKELEKEVLIKERTDEAMILMEKLTDIQQRESRS